MRFVRKYWSLLVLAACIAAALVFKRFVFIAWYPVLMSAAVASGFALSLLGEDSLCYTLAKKRPPSILPPNAKIYYRRYTQFWVGWLVVNGLIAVATIFAPGPTWRLQRAQIDVPVVWVVWNCCLSYCMTGVVLLVEKLNRDRRFVVVFQTSGSTAEPKRIVKPFSKLAKEAAYHRGHLSGLQSAKPVFLATIEPQHMYGQLWRVLLPQAARCAVDPEVILTPESLLAKMRAAGQVFLVTTPSFLECFCAYADQYDVPQNCVEIVTSGALLTAATSAAAKRVFGRAPLEIFGSTETGGVAWRRQGGADETYDWHVLDVVKVSASPDGCLVVDSPFSIARHFVMGDGVELAPDGRSFKLLGRRDRLVKIAEQRVSLPEMEAKIAALDDIREAALAVVAGRHGPALGLVAVLADEADVSRGKKALALDLRQRLLPIFPKGTVPRKYRFVHELPRNAQGKIQSARLVELLEANFVEPFVSQVVQDANSWRAELVFDADAPYFQGHFPDFAVLPGVVQLGMAQHFAEQFLHRTFTLTAVKKMKFTHVVVPGEPIGLKLIRKSENEISYEYRKKEDVCASGVMCF